MKLTQVAINRPSFMTMIFCALAVIGIYSYTNMGVDLLPKMDWPMAFIVTQYPGAGPEEIEEEISKPLEEVLSSLNGLKSIRTYSSENVSFALVEFTMSTDINVALNEVERKINSIKSTFPSGVKDPEVSKVDINSAPILRIAVNSNLKGQEFYQFIKDKIKPKLEQINGVAVVSIVGGREREIRIELDNDKLKAYNLSITQVSSKINAENLDFPLGKIKQKDKNFIVRVKGKLESLKQIENIIIFSSPTGTIYLKDIAKIIDTYKEEYTLSRLDGNPCIGLIIQKTSDANSVKTSDLVRKKLEKIEEEYKDKDLKFVIAQDITTFTRNSIHSVKVDLGLAILMVAIVLFLFLHDFKSSLIVLLSIPTSILSALIMMKMLGFSLNLITLMALTLVIGILVDDSIVVLENIHRHLENGEAPRVAALNGRSEIGLAAIAITLVDVVVFLPVAMLTGIVGKIFREFGLTVVVSTLFSLFVSFTLTPMLASRWSKLTKFVKDNYLTRFINKFENFNNKLAENYKVLLNWSLNNKKYVIIICFTSLLLSIALIPIGLIGTEFIPSGDRGEFALNIELPLGTSILKTDEVTRLMEEEIKKNKAVKEYYSIIGRSEGAFETHEKSNISQIQIKLVDKWKRKPTQEVIAELLAYAKENIPGVNVSASLISIFGSADQKPINIEVKCEDLDVLIPASEKVMKEIKMTAGTRDVESSWEEGLPELKVVLDRERCALYNLSVGEAALILRNALEGDTNTKFKDGNIEYELKIILSKKDRENPDEVGEIIITNFLGKQVKLKDIANIYYGRGPTQIARKDRSRVVTIMANMDNTRPLGDITADIKKRVKALNLPSEVTVFYGGDTENMESMFKDMIMAIIFAVLFIYMIMVSLFESYMHPFVIMFSIPVALVGALFALALTGQSLNIFSMIGVLLSMGLVTKNAILLVDYTNTLRNRGYKIIDALLEAGPIRLRPIIMTTSTMIFGMLPLALASDASGDMRKGMAIVVIGALLSSTFLTLVLVPTMYLLMENVKEKIKKILIK